jgi:hypothetical protein
VALPPRHCRPDALALGDGPMATTTNTSLLVFHLNGVSSLGELTIEGVERDQKPSDRGAWDWRPSRDLLGDLGYNSAWTKVRFGYWQQIGQTTHLHDGYNYNRPIILLYGMKLEDRSTKPEDFNTRRSYPHGPGVLWGESLGHLLVGKALIQIRWYFKHVWDAVVK